MPTAHFPSTLFILPASRDEGWEDKSPLMLQLSWPYFLPTTTAKARRIHI